MLLGLYRCDVDNSGSVWIDHFIVVADDNSQALTIAIEAFPLGVNLILLG